MILIGIDTGVKTGFAHSVNGQFVELSTQTILSAMAKVSGIHNDAKLAGTKLVVCIEDVRLRKWVDPRLGKERMRGIGSVERDCSIWQEFCETHGICYLLVPPKDIQTKTSQALFTQITGYVYEVSEDTRDAGMNIYKHYRMFKRGYPMPADREPKPFKKTAKPRLPRKKKEITA